MPTSAKLTRMQKIALESLSPEKKREVVRKLFSSIGEVVKAQKREKAVDIDMSDNVVFSLNVSGGQTLGDQSNRTYTVNMLTGDVFTDTDLHRPASTCSITASEETLIKISTVRILY